MLSISISRLREVAPGIPILVVDDGSRDGTAELARDLADEVLVHPLNRGVGAALKSGLAWLQAAKVDAVLTMGADLQRSFEDVARLILEGADPLSEVLVGSRWLGTSPSKMPLPRKLANRTILRLFNFFQGTNITDVMSGFRVLRLSALPELKRLPDDYRFDVALYRSFIRRNVVIRETPVEVYYHSDSSRMRFPVWEGVKIAFESARRDRFHV